MNAAATSQVTSKRAVEQIADAVLYEGYILYPYRPSAVKNQQRWNFGVLCPESYAIAQRGTESSTMRTECLLEADFATTLDVKIRFLHLLQRDVTDRDFERVDFLEVNGELVQSWQEAVEREVVMPRVRTCEIESPLLLRLSFPSSRSTEPLVDAESEEVSGMIVRTQPALAGEVELSATAVDRHLLKLSIVIRNITRCGTATSRDEALLNSLVSTHTILEVQEGAFVSLLDTPDNYKAAASDCVNTGTYPVLVGDEGDRSCMLSSPIILYDYPQIAPQSTGDLFDGTEIDEILTLRIMSLTDEEKREMRGADALARRLLERTESLSAEQMMRLHGVMKKT